MLGIKLFNQGIKIASAVYWLNLDLNCLHVNLGKDLHNTHMQRYSLHLISYHSF